MGSRFSRRVLSLGDLEEPLELVILTAAYRTMPHGREEQRFKTERPIFHGLSRNTLRARIPRVLHLNRKNIARASVSRSAWFKSQFNEYYCVLAIVAEWINELYGDDEAKCEVVRRAVGLFVLDPLFKTPAHYSLPL